MAEIPSADDIRCRHQDGNEYGREREQLIAAIGQFIEQHGRELAQGKQIVFTLPKYRDLGEMQRAWEKHRDGIMNELRGKGYRVTDAPEGLYISLIPPPPRRQPPAQG